MDEPEFPGQGQYECGHSVKNNRYRLVTLHVNTYPAHSTFVLHLESWTTSSTMPNDGHYNFPAGLDIKPLVSSVEDDVFDEANQKEAIIHYGIAGRVW